MEKEQKEVFVCWLDEDKKILSFHFVEGFERKEFKTKTLITFIKHSLKVNTEILLSVAQIGDSSSLKKGCFAIAIGNPYDLEIYFNSFFMVPLKSLAFSIGSIIIKVVSITSPFLTTHACPPFSALLVPINPENFP